MKNENNKSDATALHERMLTGLHLENFKAFADSQNLPIKPLTLIFGANSSGKSSLIHSLLLTNHALANGNVDVHQPRLAGQSVDLGGFQEFVHQHEVERGCTLGFTLCHQPYRTAIWFAEFSRTSLRFEIGKAIYTESGKEQSGLVGVSSFEVILDDRDFMRATRCQDGSLRVGNINFEHPYFQPFFAQINQLRPPESKFRQPQTADTFAELKEILKDPPTPEFEVSPEFYSTAERYMERDRNIRADFFGQLRAKCENSMKKVPLRAGNLVPVSARRKSLREQYSGDAEFGDVWRGLEEFDNNELFREVAKIFCFETEDLLDWLNAEFNRCFESLKYLGPLRYYPPRHLIGMHDQDPNWFSGGGHAWDILRRDQNVADKVNSWLGSLQGPAARYELRVRYLKDLGRVGNAEKQRLAARLQQVNADSAATALAAVDALLADLTGDPVSTAFGEVALVDKRTGLEVSHRDVGVGVSQVLPVLVHAYADENKIVAIEQPEIHLHPAMQAELGDVFIESALGERRNTLLLRRFQWISRTEYVAYRRRNRASPGDSWWSGNPALCVSSLRIGY